MNIKTFPDIFYLFASVHVVLGAER